MSVDSSQAASSIITPVRKESEGPYCIGEYIDELKRHVGADGKEHLGGRGRVIEILQHGREARIQCIACGGIASEQV